MLHDIELSQPRLIERITGGMYNMAKSILFCEDQHRVQKTFHRFCGSDKSRTCIITISERMLGRRERKLLTVYVLRQKR